MSRVEINSELGNILKSMEYKGGKQITFSELKQKEEFGEKFTNKPNQKPKQLVKTVTIRYLTSLVLYSLSYGF